MANIFSYNEQSTAQVNYNVTMSALGNALEKQVRTWWDICTFEQYNKDHIIVRSLRWDVVPQDGLDDAASMSEWYEFFNNVGFKLQDLVLARKRKKMALLEAKINELKTKLDAIKDSQQIVDFNNRIKKKLEKIDKDTQKKKAKKYHRDMEDFQSNNVYLWQQDKTRNIGTVNETNSQETVPSHTSTNPPRNPGTARREAPPSRPLREMSTPIRNDSRERDEPARVYYPPSYNTHHQVPVHNRFESLRDNESRNYYQSPRSFLGRGRGWQKRGRGQPQRRGRPPPPAQPQNQGEPVWRESQYWERDRVPQSSQRREDLEAVEEDEKSRKRSRARE